MTSGSCSSFRRAKSVLRKYFESLARGEGRHHDRTATGLLHSLY